MSVVRGSGARPWHGLNVGQRVAQARKQLGLTQAELGRLLGEALNRSASYSQAAISEMERDNLPVAAEVLRVLARVLQQPVSYFLGDDDSPDTSPVDLATSSVLATNFERWLRAVGLPDQFPRLTALDDDELNPERKLYMGVDRERLVSRLLDRIALLHDRAGPHRHNAKARSGWAPPTAVLMHAGHGTTTLSRFIYKRVWNEPLMSYIPVELNVAHLISDGRLATRQQLQYTFRLAILHSLIEALWDKGWGTDKHDSLLADAGDAFLRTLRRRRHPDGETRRSISSGDFDLLAKHAPLFAFQFHELLDALYSRYRLSVLFLVDVVGRTDKEDESPDYGLLGDAIDSLATMRWPEPERRIGRRQYAPFQTAYFMSYETLHALTYRQSRQFEVMECPWLRPAEIFALIARHYPPGQGQVRAHLGTVVDPAFLDDIVGPELSIRRSAGLLEARLRAATQDWDMTRFRLEFKRESTGYRGGERFR